MGPFEDNQTFSIVNKSNGESKSSTVMAKNISTIRFKINNNSFVEVVVYSCIFFIDLEVYLLLFFLKFHVQLPWP